MTECHSVERGRLLEQIYVHDIYERIASDFDSTSYRPWPSVRRFLRSLPAGSLVLDIGCGNGQYLSMNPDITVVGLDRSNNLLQSAYDKAKGVLCRADCINLPYKRNSFDAVICIGVFHHLVSSERQIQTLRELARVLKPGGQAMLYAWAYEQVRRKFSGQDLLVPRQFSDSYTTKHDETQNLEFLQLNVPSSPSSPKPGSLLSRFEALIRGPKSSNQSEGTHRSLCPDCHSLCSSLAPQEFQVRQFPASSLFTSRASTAPRSPCSSRAPSTRSAGPTPLFNPPTARSRDERYYHVFKRGEIERLTNKKVPNLTVIESKLDNGHWCVRLLKGS